MTTTISPDPVLHFVDSNGSALSGGKLFVYLAGTTTKSTSYTDSTGNTPNVNPVILNSRGEANVWLTPGTAYKFVLSPSTDTDPPTNPIYTVDNINGGISLPVVPSQGGTPLFFGGATTGSGTAQILATVTPSNFTLTSGYRVGCTAGVTNTGALTMNVNSTGAVSVLKRTASGLVALVAGDWVVGNAYTLEYDGTEFQLLDNIATIPTVPVPRGYIGGFILSNDGTTPNSVLDIAAGQAADSTNAVLITGTAFTKSTAGTWVAGSGNNAMGTGLTIANSTWYHVFAIVNNGSFDVYFDTSVTAANAPSSTTAFRRIGSFKTDGTAHILTFVQLEETFFWGTETADFNATPADTNGHLQAVNVPPGVKTRPLLRVQIGATGEAILTSPDETDIAPATTSGTSPGWDLASSAVSGSQWLYSNTSQQIRYRAAGTLSNLLIVCRGYVDSRGRFA